MMEFKNTLYEKVEGIATITINRPEVRNALNPETNQEISARLDDAMKDENIYVIVITGAGDRAFSSGADINIMLGISTSKAREFSKAGQEIFEKVETLDKPVIAAINGYALGGGLELAMACDLRIASENAKMGQTEINVGLTPGWGGTQRLPRYVGKAIAKELIFTGKMIDAKTAERYGLVNAVVPPDQLKNAVTVMAKELMKKPRIGIKLAKELINSSTETNQRTGMAHEAESFGVISQTEEFKEGVKTYLETKKPKYA
jgi:enoyl-CoA hydratase